MHKGRNGHGVLKGIAIFLAIVIMLGIIGGAVWIGLESNWYRDWSKFTGRGPNAEEEFAPPKDVTDGEGNELTSGSVYHLPSSMVFARESAQSETANAGIMVAVQITPETATDKRISWSLTWEANAFGTGSWLSGLPEESKPMSNYLSIEPDENDSTRAQVKCLAPFGNKLIIKAQSVSNPDVFDECTVNYAQRLENFSVSFDGFSGAGVNVALSSDAEAVGGIPRLELQKSSVYTLADEYNVNYSLSGRDSEGNLYVTCKKENETTHSGLVFAETKKPENAGSSFTFEECTQEDTVPQDTNSIIKTKGLYFSLPWLMENMGLHYYFVQDNVTLPAVSSVDDRTNLNGVSVSDLTERFNENYNGAGMTRPQPLLRLTVTVSGTYSQKVMEYTYFMIGYAEVKPQGVQIVMPSDKVIIF